eukprot:m.74714 g.74714  ORF g.74714 m.74714 type:complete len:170 (-) comp14528_c1_seq2:509-1018(-)
MLVGDAAQPLQRLLGTYRSRMGGSLAFTPDGRWAVTGTNTQRLLWWDLETGTLVHVHYTAAATPAAPAASTAAVASVRSIRYFPGGKQMVSCIDRAVYIDAVPLERPHTPPLCAGLQVSCLHPDVRAAAPGTCMREQTRARRAAAALPALGTVAADLWVPECRLARDTI